MNYIMIKTHKNHDTRRPASICLDVIQAGTHIVNGRGRLNTSNL